MKNFLWNMFANIQNGQLAKKAFIMHPQTKICESVLNVLWNEGFILGYKLVQQNPNKLKIFLKYNQGKPVIQQIKGVSKPSNRVYYSINQIWKIDSSKTFLILSTNQGLKTITECKKLNLGGEPLLVIH